MIVRPYRPADAAQVHAVCLATAVDSNPNGPEPADPDLIGHVFAGPYLALEPGLAFVLADEEGVAGYVLGAADSVDFYRRWRRDWSPRFADATVAAGADPDTPDARLIGLLAAPERMLPTDVADYPAHLHVDLLARARRRGHGRTLLTTLFAALDARGAAGVHLQVSEHNPNAHAFYASLGFAELARSDGGITFGRRLPSAN
ncbi:GNAT family N-acetyltransferase [Solihabitans fulvus]|uniref:GNAT family N-acetyltransferase n=1 Tax=Solihabitans fulvus TaxID=1892852 RepID=UPI0016619D6F|nr:GNAT family N-acetyltransferase [Solihabitans fulvus]